MSAPEFIWFDFGGVLSPPIPALFEQYQLKTGLAPRVLQQAMSDVADELGVPMLAPVENALLTEREWGARLEQALRRRDPQIDLSRARLQGFGEQWFAGVPANAPLVAAVRALKRNGFRVGILTNNVVEWSLHWRAMVGLDEVVDLIVDSSQERTRKPDTAFFEVATARSGVAPQHSLLIDDVAENIHAAAALGWQVLHFTDNHQALAQLQRVTGVSLLQPAVEPA
ncbi:HAD family phosphatase [Pseudomonas aylmerensis]|uniref:HAD family phosphatase n=1 Tax=Pseudomonas aylmerensis TaxID=1869229 RepID=A0A2T4G1Q2_9PSED|nr:HAD family phosphatase [Pseudomonas aylmerensis]OCW20962.1 haloacid dehalogenase [Pseudomonas aylmerensis]PTC29557.1 HAD family phosphatase [Pseudomonas aylmerensis]